MTKVELAQRVKVKYPQYQNIDNEKLSELILAKYPQYQKAITEPEEEPETYKDEYWQKVTEEQTLPEVGRDPKAGILQNTVEAMLNPAEMVTMAGAGAGVAALGRGTAKQIGKKALSYGTYGGSDIVSGVKGLGQNLARGFGAKGKEAALKTVPKITPEALKRTTPSAATETIKKGLQPAVTEVGKAPATEAVKTIVPDTVKVTRTLGPQGETPKELSWDMVRNYWGKRWGTEYKMKAKWDNELRSKFGADELEDMMYYREKTGNIFRENDTFEAVQNRLSVDAKKVVDDVIDEHIGNSLKAWNASPFTKDIKARQEVQEIYLTHVYDGKVKPAYEHAMGVLKNKFKTNNPMKNKRTYLTFEEALKEKGLVPKFRNMADQLDYQDSFTNRLLANNELIEKTHQLEKFFGAKFIGRPNAKNYNQLRQEGWEPFYDPFLRTYVVGKNKNGTPKFAVHNAPALLHPDYADAVKSVFQKDVYKPENMAWKGYDSFNNWVRNIRVTLSGFHFVPLAESLVGSKGIKALNIKDWWQAGTKILKDPDIVGDMLAAGLRLRAPREVSRTQIEGAINAGVNKLQLSGMPTASKIAKNVAKPYMWVQDLLWNKYHPRLKAIVFSEYQRKFLMQAEKQGRKLGAREIKEANREVASLVNDQFGHQAWEMTKHFNDPEMQKWMHRLIGYPDWTISALRQAKSAFEGGLRGKLGREYWARYGVGFLVGQNLASYINTGFHNDPRTGEVKWSLDKSHSTFENDDPMHKFDFQLPDVEFNIAGIKWNPGRETKEDGSEGRKYYSHLGKQMLEIPRYLPYFGDTVGQLFAKSAPAIQILGKQLMGGTPYEGEIFPARGEYKEGQFKSWDATEPNTLERAASRGKQAVSDVLPFSIQQIREYGVGTATLAPISKGISGHAAIDYFVDYFKNRDYKARSGLRKLLRDQGYSSSYISGIMTRARKKAREK